MNREEAVKLLEHISIAYTPTDAYGDYDDPQPYEEALNMAIEALSEGNIARDIATILENEQDMRVILNLVRCKDCKHYIVEGITTQYGWCHEYKHSVDEDDFCSYGERKDDQV